MLEYKAIKQLRANAAGPRGVLRVGGCQSLLDLSALPSRETCAWRNRGRALGLVNPVITNNTKAGPRSSGSAVKRNGHHNE